MKEIEPTYKTKNERNWKLLKTGALVGALLLGGGGVLQHEQGQNSRIEALQQENKRLYDKLQNTALPENLRGELLLLWVNTCVNQSTTDTMRYGETDIVPTEEGFRTCREWSKKWRDQWGANPTWLQGGGVR